MTPRIRKFALTVHVTSSVGWLGAVIAYLALALAVLTGHDAEMTRAAWLAMDLIGWSVIVPLAFAALLSGIAQGLGSSWGLFRHYWVLVKLLLTVFATTILVLHMPTVSSSADIAKSATLSIANFPDVRSELVHAGGGLLVLLVTTM